MNATLDVAALRAETPGTRRVNHLNNAGAGLVTDRVLTTVREHLELEAQIGGYEAADAVATRLRGVYEAVAGLVGAQAHNIALVEHATADVHQVDSVGLVGRVSVFNLGPFRGEFEARNTWYYNLDEELASVFFEINFSG